MTEINGISSGHPVSKNLELQEQEKINIIKENLEALKKTNSKGQEDELAVVDIKDDNNSSSSINTTSSGTTNTTTATSSSSTSAELEFLRNEQQAQIDEMARIQKEITDKSARRSKLKAKLNSKSTADDSVKSNLQKKIEELGSDIESLNGKLQTCISNLDRITSSVQQVMQKEQMAAQAAAQTSANQGQQVQATNGVTPVSSNQSVNYAGVQLTTIPQDLAQRIDAKLGAGFCAKTEEVAAKLKCNPNDLLAMMYSESGLDPHYYESDGTVGLISLLSEEVIEHGYDPAQIAAMSGIDQLDIVYQFMNEAKTQVAGYSESDTLDAGTMYAINYVPAWAQNETLCSKYDDTAWAYEPNYPLDVDGDGYVTKTDLAKTISQQFEELNQYF